jgi:hypothetical protein
MNRRQFVISNSAFGISYLTSNIGFSKVEQAKSENAVIYLFLSGGASHIETFNPVPNAPVEIRSTTGIQKTKVPGEYIGGLHPELARRSDKISFVRSFAHKDSNHRSAQHLNLTGGKVVGDSQQNWPSFGSCASHKFGSNSKEGLPNYVKLNSHPHTSASSLGQKFGGYEASPEGLGDLSLKISIEHLNKRRQMLKIVDNSSVVAGSQIAKDYAELREQAISSLTGNIATVFKIDEDKSYDDFKGNRLGEDLLRSIRLIENGCKFVFLTTGGWDMHNNILQGLTSLQTPLDLYIAKAIDLLQARGLSNVLLVVSTEFGRTYKININAGRDHGPSNIPLMMYSPMYDMGRFIGKTNDTANEVIENPFGPDDLTNTILSHIGITKGQKWTGSDGRPHDFIQSGSKNILL